MSVSIRLTCKSRFLTSALLMASASVSLKGEEPGRRTARLPGRSRGIDARREPSQSERVLREMAAQCGAGTVPKCPVDAFVDGAAGSQTRRAPGRNSSAKETGGSRQRLSAGR